MSFPRYPEYKDSGVEWLGEVPAHWDVVKLGLIGVFKGGAGFPEEHQGQTTFDIPFFKVGDIGQADVDGALRNANHTISQDTARLLRARVLPVWTIVFAKVGAALLLQRYRWLGQPSCIDNNMMGLIVNRNCVPQFLLHLLPLLDLSMLANPGAVPSINEEQISNHRVVLPPLPEQVAISNFLDRETAKIDELVAEQQRLIELLKEKREAVISLAVTKGLNPNAPMKPSGVEWLGEVPAHWAVLPLKRLIADDTSISYGIVQPGEPLATGVPFVQTTNMSSGTFDLDSLQRTSAEIASAYPRSALTGGEVILGIRASIGAAHVVPMELAGANLSRGVARIVPGCRVTSQYLVAYFGTAAVAWYWELSKQGSTFNEVSIATVRELAVCVPPDDEQVATVGYIDIKLKQFDALAVEAQRAIELLQERRTALISAAVTGQIDVRAIADRAAA
ncbi:restriction endonuclease subunit S [Corallococcus carmarthensis]|uniref:Restriction endonuclease subunit S n=1 Tax=Corallococcus carmarthensis TaxID=2316728 RepID=A0A3A8KGW0_9BACT|nr:restriction endonuclease subunit S [Corallococcus carmarthensis]RKH06766.1 restriction endonuclease subunit S [Corallococcus carmarthensis]